MDPLTIGNTVLKGRTPESAMVVLGFPVRFPESVKVGLEDKVEIDSAVTPSLAVILGLASIVAFDVGIPLDLGRRSSSV